MRTTITGCFTSSVKRKNPKFSFLAIGFVCIIFLLFGLTSNAQPAGSNCKSGCTSNDVQIIGAFLSDTNGVQLTNYVCGSGDPVFLSLRLTTNTPRIGVSIYADIQTVLNGVATGTSVGTVSQCFGTSLNTTGSIVTFPNRLNWPCGQQIALVGTYTAWGTGNANFCTGTAFQCGGTPSKCHLAPADSIIIIQLPNTNPATQTLCETTAGSGSARFNFTLSDTAVGQGNVRISWYDSYNSTTKTWGTIIADSTNHLATDGTIVVAKVCDALHPTACSPANLTLYVKLQGTANSGGPYTMCSSTTSITLNGTYGGAATGGSWSGGGGTYGTPSTNTTNKIVTVSYTPSATERTNGTANVTFTTSGQSSPCTAASQGATITINPAASVVSVGGPYTMCSSTASITLTGTYGGGATGGSWSGGGGTYGTPSTNTTNKTVTVSYSPSATEITNGSASVTFATTGQSSPCTAASQGATITINPAASVVNVGGPYTMCSSATSITLTGTYGGGATGGSWSGGGGTYGTPSTNTTNKTVTVSYTPSATERTNGTASVTFATTGQSSPCTAASQGATITINPAASVVNVGGPYTMCSSATSITLTGTYGGGATGGSWSGGGGTYGTPSTNTTNKTVTVSYTPSATEITNGSASVTFTTTGQSSPCTAASQGASITINTTPVAPTVSYIPPTCLETTFSVTVDNPHSGSTYTLRQLSGGVSVMTKVAPADVVGGKITFGGLTVGKGYRVTETASGGCISSASSCGDFSSITGATTQRIQDGNATSLAEPTVNAYPNPFNDNVKFIISSPAAGNGSLDIYNVMGQKVKSVYQGRILAGTNSFELTIPKKQQETLIYIFRVGDKKVTGKLLQLNR